VLLKYPSYGGIEITKFTEAIHQDRVYDGFEFSTYVEYRDIEQMMVKAALLNPHEIAIQIPALNHQFWEDYESVWSTPIMAGGNKTMKNFFCDRLKVAHNKLMYKLRANNHLKYRVIILKFSRSLHLSNSIYSPTSVDGEIDNIVMPMVTSLPNTVVTSIRVAWKVHIHDENAEQIGEAGDALSKKSENMELMKDLLSKMKFAPSTNEGDIDFD
jgi:hypothetical protein